MVLLSLITYFNLKIMNKKNLLRICVYVVGFSFLIISNSLLFHMIPSQTKFFSTMGMIRYGLTILIFIIFIWGINLTLRKYGAQIIPTPKTRMIGIIIMVALLAVGLGFTFVLFMNK